MFLITPRAVAKVSSPQQTQQGLGDAQVVAGKTPNPRARVQQACDRCRSKKAKCNGETPCRRCEKEGLLCIFTQAPYDPKTSARKYVTSLEAQQRAFINILQSIQRRYPHAIDANELQSISSLSNLYTGPLTEVSGQRSTIDIDHDVSSARDWSERGVKRKRVGDSNFESPTIIQDAQTTSYIHENNNIFEDLNMTESEAAARIFGIPSDTNPVLPYQLCEEPNPAAHTRHDRIFPTSSLVEEPTREWAISTDDANIDTWPFSNLELCIGEDTLPTLRQTNLEFSDYFMDENT
ncbi:hypothetical protein TWF694_011530 [Orbilia ellipsospora]|uniref:Zn(2)-C6 fungal-type domain-containing protein n=1 Tax=Orbilia ellipsospora TaxID=2528407 RepID=A0AAV9X5I9_9PEZI